MEAAPGGYYHPVAGEDGGKDGSSSMAQALCMLSAHAAYRWRRGGSLWPSVPVRQGRAGWQCLSGRVHYQRGPGEGMVGVREQEPCTSPRGHGSAAPGLSGGERVVVLWMQHLFFFLPCFGQPPAHLHS